jgi:hypothetical protein
MAASQEDTFKSDLLCPVLSRRRLYRRVLDIFPGIECVGEC